MKKYKLLVEFETDENCNIESILSDGRLYNDDFRGVITNARLTRCNVRR